MCGGRKGAVEPWWRERRQRDVVAEREPSQGNSRPFLATPEGDLAALRLSGERGDLVLPRGPASMPAGPKKAREPTPGGDLVGSTRSQKQEPDLLEVSQRAHGIQLRTRVDLVGGPLV